MYIKIYHNKKQSVQVDKGNEQSPIMMLSSRKTKLYLTIWYFSQNSSNYTNNHIIFYFTNDDNCQNRINAVSSFTILILYG